MLYVPEKWTLGDKDSETLQKSRISINSLLIWLFFGCTNVILYVLLYLFIYCFITQCIVCSSNSP